VPVPSAHLSIIHQKLQGLEETMQRCVMFSKQICELESTDASRVFREICIHPGITREPRDILAAEAAFNALINNLWPEEHLQHTREAAAYLDDEVTLALLISPKRLESVDDPTQIPGYSNDRVLTLGERKSLASVPSRSTLEKAMMDPHPDVARKLLDNPRLTETDVVRIAAKSTMAPLVLCEIAAHPRWRKQPIVQKALVHNRLLPADFGLTLLPFLEKRVLHDVSRDARLDDTIQHAAAVLLAGIESARRLFRQ
jgi:hypothetical protein